jgi:hypothetical protein
LKCNHDTLQWYHTGSYDPDDKLAKSLHELVSKISLEPNIFEVLHVAGSWWSSWRTLWPPLTGGAERSSLVDFVHFSLSQDNLANVASALICIANSLQQMSAGVKDYDLQFSTPPNELANNLLTAVDQLVFADDDNLTSLDGLEALILRAKSYVNVSNQPRKSWLLIRRAISMAQVMDLPRADHDEDTAETTRPQRFLGVLFETDRFMSLLLGLPYAVDDNFDERVAQKVLGSPADVQTQMRALRRIVALAAGKVNDRNTSRPDSQGSPIDLIQQTLDDAGSTLPSEWWNVETHSEASFDPQLSHEHLLTQLWFYQVQSFLHLPLMLKPASDARFERSRLVCLSSSRSLLRVYQALRQPKLAQYASKCVDFQALTAVILVLLGFLQQKSQDWHRANVEHKDDVDLISTTRQVFELSSMEQGGSIASQGVHVIDSLSGFVADGERANFFRTAALFVPYFGTVSVQLGRDNVSVGTASTRTNSIAYSESGLLLSSSSQQQQHDQRSETYPPSVISPTGYPVASNTPSSVNPQSGSPGQLFKCKTYLPMEEDEYAHVSRTIAPLPPPLPPPPFDPFRPNCFSGNTIHNGDGIGNIGVDIDWQRLMAGAELDFDHGWNVDLSATQVIGKLY